MSNLDVAAAPIFEARITPYRSLNRRGVAILVFAMSVFTVAVALRFWLWGAWPVVFFSFLEVPLLILMLVINSRRARASELIMLTPQRLTVIRTDPTGRRNEESFPSAWLRIEFEAVQGGIPRILLRSHGQAYEVGSFLHDPEKQSLFSALRAALHDARNPRFDNPQLRDD